MFIYSFVVYFYSWNENYSFTELIKLIEIHSLNLPSLQFGLDTAIHDIKSQQSNISISRFIRFQLGETTSSSKSSNSE